MLLLILASFFQATVSQDTLILSQVVFRHGSRGPNWAFTSNETSTYFYKGLGELTDEGVQQGYDLGRALRARLVDARLIDIRYIPSQISFKSSMAGRCMLTAASVGAGIFDSVNSTIPNPVLVQTTTDDYLCVPQTTPKILSSLMTKAGGTANSNSTTIDLMNLLWSKWKVNSTYFQTNGSLGEFDNWAIEKAAKLPVPGFFTDQAAKEAEYYTNEYNQFLTGTGEYNNTEFVRCRSGLLVYTILNNIRMRANCTDKCPSQKFNAFATHDYMIMCLLTSFGIMEKALGTELTPTAAAVLFELYQPINNGSKYVKASEIVFRQKVPKVLYRRPGSTFIPLTAYVPGCGAQENCPIDNFTSCCDSYTSSNPKGECIFRHSARAPVAMFTSEASKNYFYRGLGEISDDGLRLAYDLGQALRPRLIDSGFLDPRYIPSQSSFRSSASGRCIVTASAVGSALFNPVNASIPNQVNVQTMNSTDDWLCVPQTTQWLVEQMYKSVGAEYNSTSTLEELSMDLLKNWTANSTVFQQHASELDIDALPIEKDAGLPVPHWYDDAVQAETSYYLSKVNNFYTGTREYEHSQWIRCRSGLLLYTIMNNIKRKAVCGSNCTSPKFYAYTTHDFMVQSLLGGFGLVDAALQGGVPPFTGAILIELWQNKNNSYVKLLWRSPKAQFVSLTSKIGNCFGLENCPVDQFTSCCSNYSSATPQTECNYPVSVAVQQAVVTLLVMILFSHF